MAESLIIIGAGIAGLAAGCYAQMNGYRTQIFELHNIAGGLCTAWEREGYWFDGCIHYLFGTAAGQPFHRVWEELGAVQGRQIVNHDELTRVVGPDGRTLITYADPDRLEQHLKALSPGDRKLAEELAEGIRTFMDFDMSLLQEKPREAMTPSDWRAFSQKILPFAIPLARWGPLSAREFAARFKDPFLRRAIPLMFGWADVPMMAAMALLAYMHKGNAGFPIGGSLRFSQAIERRYRELGGEIHYNAQVEKILVEHGCAVGVRLYDDREVRADIIISAADGHATLFDMLDERVVDPRFRERYDGRLPIHSQLQFSIGVNRDLSTEPHWAIYLLDEPRQIGGQAQHDLGVKHYCFDPTLAPAGKSVVEVMIPTSYAYWQRIYGRKSYRTEQLQVAESVKAFLEQRYVGIGAQIETLDVATPMSYERYTGNWRGSTCGWLLTDKTMMLMVQGMPKTLPGLDGFYMAGQWVEPGGSVPAVAMSGRNVIQMICHRDGRPFVTSTSAIVPGEEKEGLAVPITAG